MVLRVLLSALALVSNPVLADLTGEGAARADGASCTAAQAALRTAHPFPQVRDQMETASRRLQDLRAGLQAEMRSTGADRIVDLARMNRIISTGVYTPPSSLDPLPDTHPAIRDGLRACIDERVVNTGPAGPSGRGIELYYRELLCHQQAEYRGGCNRNMDPACSRYLMDLTGTAPPPSTRSAPHAERHAARFRAFYRGRNAVYAIRAGALVDSLRRTLQPAMQAGNFDGTMGELNTAVDNLELVFGGTRDLATAATARIVAELRDQLIIVRDRYRTVWDLCHPSEGMTASDPRGLHGLPPLTDADIPWVLDSAGSGSSSGTAGSATP